MATILGVDDIASKGTEPDDARPWLAEISQAEKDAQPFYTRSKNIMRRYLMDSDNLLAGSSFGTKTFPTLWANIQVLMPATYANAPKASVTRRFSDQDTVGKSISDVLQRGLDSVFELSDIDTCLKAVRDDFLIVGRGTAWVRYEPKIVQVPAPWLPEDDTDNAADIPGAASYSEEQHTQEEDKPQTIDQLQDETIRFDFVNWADFIYPVARSWAELPWVARRVFLDKQAAIGRFGKEAVSEMKAQTKPDEWYGNGADPSRKIRNQYCIYEIWSKRDNKVLWVAKGYKTILDQGDPLYQLHGFFPCPAPAFATRGTDSLTPVPDFVYYQDQANIVNDLTAKIDALNDSLKLVGFYPAGADGGISNAIEQAVKGNSANIMIPIPAFGQWQATGGVNKNIEWMPLETVVAALKAAIDLRRQIIEDIYQITGISDIIRGASQASETATAQKIKAQWGGVRIKDKQAEIARFARDMARIAAEIMAEKFQPETLWRMTGLKFPTEQQKEQIKQLAAQQAMLAQQKAQMPPQSGASGMPPPEPTGAIAQPLRPQPPSPAGAAAPTPPADGSEDDMPTKLQKLLRLPTQEQIIAVLRDDQLRSYRVDIETDSTIQADQEAEKASRNEFVAQVGTFLNTAMPLAQTSPELLPLLGQLLLFAVRPYNVGQGMEDEIESTIENMEKSVRAAQSNGPPPDPAVIKAQAQIEADKAKAVADGQLQQQRAQTDTQIQAAKLASDNRAEQQRAAVDTKIEIGKAVADHALQQQKMQGEMQLQQQKFALEAEMRREQMIWQQEQDRQWADANPLGVS